MAQGRRGGAGSAVVNRSLQFWEQPTVRAFFQNRRTTKR